MSDSANNQHRITIEDLSGDPSDGLSKKQEPTKSIPVEPLEGVSVVDHPPSYEYASADSAPAYSAASVSAQTSAPVGTLGSVTQQLHTRPDDSPTLTRIPLNKKYGGGGECCCPASRGKCCCLALILIVILFVILGIIAKTNNDACSSLSPDGEDRIYYSYDPNIYTNFSIDSSDSYIQNGALLIFQNSSNVTDATIWVQMAAPGRAPAHIDFISQQQSNYQMRFHQSSGGPNFLGLFGMSASCIKVRVGLVLPQQMASPTIQADNFDIQAFPINAQSLNVKSTNGDIFVDQLYANDITLSTDHGDIIGDIESLRNVEISSGGSINMWMNVAPNVTNSNISAISYDGYVVLRLNNSFVGTYEILANNGETNRTSYGTVGNNGTGTLKVDSYQGNAVVKFS